MQGLSGGEENIMTKNVVIGVSDHGGWAVLVTADKNGTLIDRRRVKLVDEGLPKIPHHHEAQLLPIDEAIVLVKKVQESAEHHSKLVLEKIASELSVNITGIALRRCPQLPVTIAERLMNYHARNNADWVMYRMALAVAAEARGWPVHWFDPRKVYDLASKALGVKDLGAHFAELRRSIGPPWGQDHKLAMAAAIVCAYEFDTYS